MISAPLARAIRGHRSLLVAYSGGVDSAVLAVAARRLLGSDRMLAVLGVSPSLAAAQRAQAVAIARDHAVPLLEVPTHELDETGYVANAPDRCYFCKRELWRRLADVAAERGLAAIADGTNADDPAEHRPGGRAGREWGIVSPLAEAGLSKSAVRAVARRLGLPIWDAPAAPCLASRVLYGIAVTPERLRQVEDAETALRDVGVTGDLRVRHRGAEARIEVAADQIPVVRAHGIGIAARLRSLGFARVTIDLAGYRRGSLLRGGTGAVEALGGAGVT
jgi:pyridinium-3,5-biscarboxylic acid mononucleotide sulfurtransferase